MSNKHPDDDAEANTMSAIPNVYFGCQMFLNTTKFQLYTQREKRARD